MQSYKFIFIIMLAFFVLENLYAQSEWELQKETDEIKVYFKQSDAETYCVKVETSFPVHYQLLIDEVFQNITEYPEWIYRCAEAKWLDKNEDYRILYTVSSIPWPFQDRDVVTKMLHPKIKGKIIILHSYSVPDYIPDKANLKRQEFSEVCWYLTPGENNVQITYHLTIKVTENIPDFILKMVACKGPYESFKNLHVRLSEK
ncbi:MAG: hypothetical protein PF590_09270 [Candidatus Delongbacteria bacterium]|nr:hypothetical protein [Candidatus Delongbacteria bacterium]